MSTLLVISVALPAAASATSARAATGAVLSVDRQYRTVQVLSVHGVHGYRYSRAPGLAVGAGIRFSASHGRVRVLTQTAKRVRQLAYAATVVSYGGSGLLLRLSDRGLLSISARRVMRACGSSTPQLRVGERLRVREVRSRGAYRLVLRATDGSAVCVEESGGGVGTGGTLGAQPTTAIQRADGVVTAIDASDVVVQPAGAASLTLNAPADAIDALVSSGSIALSTCETVSVSYHQTANGLALDSLAITGQASLGCVEQDGVSLLVVGRLESVGSSTFTVDVPGQGALTIGQGDPDNPATDGLTVGDQILVAYAAGGGNSLTATDADEDVMYTTGTVTSVNAGAVVIKDWTTGASEKLLADEADFGSVRSGDAVGIAYYSSAAGLEGQNVDDLTNGTNG